MKDGPSEPIHTRARSLLALVPGDSTISSWISWVPEALSSLSPVKLRLSPRYFKSSQPRDQLRITTVILFYRS